MYLEILRDCRVGDKRCKAGDIVEIEHKEKYERLIRKEIGKPADKPKPKAKKKIKKED